MNILEHKIDEKKATACSLAGTESLAPNIATPASANRTINPNLYKQTASPTLDQYFQPNMSIQS